MLSNHDVMRHASRFGYDGPVELEVRPGVQSADVLVLKDRGVRPTSRGLWFVSTAHSDADVAETVGRLDEALGAL